MWRILSSSNLPLGTLAENAFRRYLTQDYLFLIHFARSYALLVSKLRTLPEMRAAAASMNAILNELPLARRLLCPVGD
ncbi:thiaminase II [Klebsiella pneumoniae]|uniref:Thiaminase II n=1 Tax=Klebsiella pneumoniae TaxID=573 RepID=A0A447RGF4_KLEPN|nr:thiaminase II [Klebsiella pneumoniae]